MAVVAPRARGSYALASLAALVAAAALIVALIIGAAIVLYVYAPHTTGTAVSWVKHAASWLTQPFHNVINANGDRHIWLNWGLAAAVYLVVGLILARVMRGGSRV
jgi:hypothetical protein